MQLESVKQNEYAIQYIKEPSEEVQFAAVQQDIYTIQFIKEPSEKVISFVKGEIKYIDFNNIFYIDNMVKLFIQPPQDNDKQELLDIIELLKNIIEEM